MDTAEINIYNNDELLDIKNNERYVPIFMFDTVRDVMDKLFILYDMDPRTTLI